MAERQGIYARFPVAVRQISEDCRRVLKKHHCRIIAGLIDGITCYRGLRLLNGRTIYWNGFSGLIRNSDGQIVVDLEIFRLPIAGYRLTVRERPLRFLEFFEDNLIDPKSVRAVLFEHGSVAFESEAFLIINNHLDIAKANCLKQARKWFEANRKKFDFSEVKIK